MDFRDKENRVVRIDGYPICQRPRRYRSAHGSRGTSLSQVNNAPGRSTIIVPLSRTIRIL